MCTCEDIFLQPLHVKVYKKCWYNKFFHISAVAVVVVSYSLVDRNNWTMCQEDGHTMKYLNLVSLYLSMQPLSVLVQVVVSYFLVDRD
jgi:hypothetical protein